MPWTVRYISFANILRKRIFWAGVGKKNVLIMWSGLRFQDYVDPGNGAASVTSAVPVMAHDSQ